MRLGLMEDVHLLKTNEEDTKTHAHIDHRSGKHFICPVDHQPQNSKTDHVFHLLDKNERPAISVWGWDEHLSEKGCRPQRRRPHRQHH